METTMGADSASQSRHGSGWLGWAILALFCGAVGGLLLFSHRGGVLQPSQLKIMQATRTLALAMFQYANDNEGRYPDGTSSTEVFQKLIDGNYIADPAIVYIPMPGKVKASGGTLKPGNVCYDVTSGVTSTSPDGVPVVYLTGFRVDYHPDGEATSLVRPFPMVKRAGTSRWEELFRGSSEPVEGFIASYHSNRAFFKTRVPQGGTLPINADGFGVVPHVIPADFEPSSGSYHQLTPQGVLK